VTKIVGVCGGVSKLLFSFLILEVEGTFLSFTSGEIVMDFFGIFLSDSDSNSDSDSTTASIYL